jgi:hypothetical protein
MTGIPLKTCQYNSGWVRGCFGDDILNQIGDQPISCSGVVMGDTENVYRYLGAAVQTAIQRGRGCTSMGGGDQGVHNYVLHYLFWLQSSTNFVAHMVDNEHAMVATMGYVTPKDWVLDKEKGIVYWARDKSIPAIVHQYDRLGDIVAVYDAHYSQ